MKETADSHFEEEVKQSKTKVIVEEYEKLSSSLIFESSVMMEKRSWTGPRCPSYFPPWLQDL